ncbi:MAG TPA: hypothetical protein VFD82_02380 [Planctomycetota bacterium]|nr:hypothetical protein [Planctomycetota bacterium]
MTKSVVTELDRASAVREPRPFLYLEPAPLVPGEAVDPVGCEILDARVMPSVPALVASLVDYTIERQYRRELERGNPQPIQLSVLNRRRRSARAWILAILGGNVDQPTLHALATQWIPMLAGSGPDLEHVARPGRELTEFVRGAITACIFDEPAENLLPHARALHALESTLALHLAAIQHVASRI